MATTAIALCLFLLAAGWIWERLFTTNVRASAEEQMLIVAYGLVDATKKDADAAAFRGSYASEAGRREQVPAVGPSILLPDELGEPRLSRPNSGLYAYIETADGTLAWRSPSMAITSVDATPKLRPPPGDSRFHKIEIDGIEPRFLLGYTVILEELDDLEPHFLGTERSVPVQCRDSRVSQKSRGWRDRRHAAPDRAATRHPAVGTASLATHGGTGPRASRRSTRRHRRGLPGGTRPARADDEPICRTRTGEPRTLSPGDGRPGT